MQVCRHHLRKSKQDDFRRVLKIDFHVLFILRYDRYCADHYGNGVCDRSCHTAACGWDGLDCSADFPPILLPGTLIIVVRLQPKELLGDLRGFLRSLGALLRTNLVVKLSKDNEPMVYPYTESTEDFELMLERSRVKRELEKEVIGYENLKETLFVL